MHHDRVTGEYCGATCASCLEKSLRRDEKINFVFHNLKGYDSHLIVRAYKGYINGKGKRAGDISVIANTDEKYMTFEVGGFMFKDSLQHLPTSLASLVDGLEGNTPYMKGEYPDRGQLLAREGVYLYE